jgi:hypothetical protein
MRASDDVTACLPRRGPAEPALVDRRRKVTTVVVN